VDYNYPDVAILVFCKAPVAGQVKTRLIPALTPEQAANAHIEITQYVLSELTKVQLCPIQLWCSPDTSHLFFSECLEKYPISLHQQQGDDLGARMNHAISSSLKSYSKVLLIGSDVPSLTIDDVEFAVNALDNTDIVIAPAQDGGYVMIAMAEPHPELFMDMQWGHADVFSDTKHKIQLKNLMLTTTSAKWDVDYIDDWLKFKSLIST